MPGLRIGLPWVLPLTLSMAAIACSSSSNGDASPEGAGGYPDAGSADASHDEAEAEAAHVGTVALPAACASTTLFDCDPVSGAGCDSGASCDFSAAGFACYPGPNVADVGAACDGTTGPFCKQGASCVPAIGAASTTAGACEKFCCADADCPAGFSCAAPPLAVAGSLGFCEPLDAGAADAAPDDADDGASDASDAAD